MASYRLYLADNSEHIRAGESFAASDRTEAVEIAACVFDACSDQFAHAELWCGPEPVATSRDKLAERQHDLETIVRRHQEQVLSLEESLQRSFRCVARSQRLIERTNALLAISRGSTR